VEQVILGINNLGLTVFTITDIGAITNIKIGDCFCIMVITKSLVARNGGSSLIIVGSYLTQERRDKAFKRFMDNVSLKTFTQ